jgi:hypothetical protein
MIDHKYSMMLPQSRCPICNGKISRCGLATHVRSHLKRGEMVHKKAARIVVS